MVVTGLGNEFNVIGIEEAVCGQVVGRVIVVDDRALGGNHLWLQPVGIVFQVIQSTTVGHDPAIRRGPIHQAGRFSSYYPHAQQSIVLWQ